VAARDFKDNANAPQIRFVRINGRVIPIVNKQKVMKAAPLVESRIDEMTSQVQSAEAGKRNVGKDENGNVVKNFGTQSTFPGFYGALGFRNKNDFYKTVMQRQSKKFDNLAEQAIDDLKGGYQTQDGRVPPNRDFRVLTKQTFDNRGVTFRNINGRVVPLRNKHDEVPF
jgi:hypothetical protein